MVKYIVIGIFVIAVAAVLLRSLVRPGRKCRIPASAAVVDVRRSGFSRDGELYVPVVEFRVNGQVIRGEGGGMSGESPGNKYHVGDALEILYNEKKPEEFVIAGESNRAGVILAFIFLLVGILMIGAGVYGLVKG